MPGFSTSLAGSALSSGTLTGKKKQRVRSRRGTAGAAFGSAINTQPLGPPVNSVSRAAITSPVTPIGTKKRAGLSRQALV